MAELLVRLLARTVYTFVRHGDAAQAEVNFNRLLTDKGREQAVWLREHIRRDEMFDLILRSPTPRTIDTTSIILGSMGQWYNEVCPDRVRTVPELYLPPEGTKDWRLVNGMYEEIGSNAPLRRYMEHGDWKAYVMFAATGTLAVLHATTKASAHNVLIVGHSVSQQAIAKTICEYAGVPVPHALLDEVLGSGEAFVLQPSKSVDEMVTFIRQPAT